MQVDAICLAIDFLTGILIHGFNKSWALVPSSIFDNSRSILALKLIQLLYRFEFPQAGFLSINYPLKIMSLRILD
jgi:hypothetical protein